MSDDPCEDDYAEPQFPDGAIVRDMPIVNRKGLHARATAKFVQCVEKFDAEIMVSRCGETVGGTSIMGIYARRRHGLDHHGCRDRRRGRTSPHRT